MSTDDTSPPAAPDGVSVSISPSLGGAVRPLDPAHDISAAAILAASTIAGTTEAGLIVLQRARSDEASAIFGVTVGDDVVAVYITRKIPLSIEVTALAVAVGHRGRGYGRACMTDALRGAGKFPLVVETDDDALGFYKTCGFKLVGRRISPEGRVRYRLGWHAPGLRDKVGSTTDLTRDAVARERTHDREPTMEA